MPHKSAQEIEKALEEAKSKVVLGGVYSHYKNPEHHVRVVEFGIQEATDKVCVIYQDTKNEKLVFVRDLDVWLENPIKDTLRFRLISK